MALFLLCSTAGAQGFLRASKGRVVDEKGREIIWRGMGLGGWMLQEPYMLQLSGVLENQSAIRKKISGLIGEDRTRKFYDAWLENFCTRQDIDSLASWGFNSVRLPLHYNLFTLPAEEEPVKGKNTWLEKGFRLTDSLLAWCRANRIYLILDLHAAPGGQGRDHAISDRDSTRPSLWESEANRQKTIELWRRLATRYVNEPWIGAYDLINEPNWGFTDPADRNGCAEKDNTPLRKLLMDITAAIREVDQKHIIIIEGNCWGNNYQNMFPLWDSNLVLSFHKYWNENSIASIRQFIDYREKYGVPVWMGESGENSNAWFRGAVSLFEQNGIGWAWWPLKKLGINNPLRIRSNPQYEKLVAFWKGTGQQPSAEEAFEGLMQLAADSRTDRNVFQRDVVDAMFRQVRQKETIPFAEHLIDRQAVVYAVHYDLGPMGEAYYSKDSANLWVTTGQRTQWNRGWAYRNDAVDIEPARDPHSNGFMVSSLQAGEWLQYSVTASAAATYTISLQVNGVQASIIAVEVNGKKVAELPVTAGKEGSVSLPVGSVRLNKGSNKIRVATTTGEVSLTSLVFTRTQDASAQIKKN